MAIIENPNFGRFDSFNNVMNVAVPFHVTLIGSYQGPSVNKEPMTYYLFGTQVADSAPDSNPATLSPAEDDTTK